jgi:DNA-binding transcriptional ArsR family regulator
LIGSKSGIIIKIGIKGDAYIMKNIIEVILNPIRIRIIQEAAVKQIFTTADLCEKMNDIPRTTLYRHINILLKNNILTVVSEKKIRGSLERAFTLNMGELTNINTLENATHNVMGFFINKCMRFQNYLNGDNPDPNKDKLFLTSSVLMLNDHEFDQFLSDLWELIQKYNLEYEDGRKARDISVISSPVDNNK